MIFISLLEKIVIGVSLLILIFLVFIISSMDNEISHLMQEVEVQEVFVEQLEKEVDRLHRKCEDCKRSKESIETRGRLLGTFEATAYTDDVESQGKWVGETASGMKPQVGVIAVDPKVIPLGTKLYVEGYGNAIAGDTGGAIKGRMLDVFFNTKNECIQWGRKQVNVWIVD